MKKYLSIAALLLSTSVFAGEIKPYSEDTFNTLMANNAPVMIDVHATWCGTCKKQGKIIDAYMTDMPDNNLTVLQVDFDDQKNIVKQFKATKSTFVLFSNGKEIDRAIAQTDQGELFTFFAQAEQ